MISGRSDLFSNLDKLYSPPERLESFERIIGFLLTSCNKPVITEIGFSNLIHFCYNGMKLTDDEAYNRAFAMCVFQVFDASTVRRNGGMLNAYNVIVAPDSVKTAEFSKMIKVVRSADYSLIKVDGVISSFVCTYANLKRTKASLKNMRYSINQIGCFKQGLSTGYDALAFLSPKLDIEYTVDVEGVPIRLPEMYYRQLVAEAKLLMKYRNIDDSEKANLKMHGNGKYGFVRPNKPEFESKNSHLVCVLDKCNKNTFTETVIDGRTQLRYQFQKCLLEYLPSFSDGMTLGCKIQFCINRIIKHRLLHFGGYGDKCLSKDCKVKGCTDFDIVKIGNLQTNQQLSEIMESIKIANGINEEEEEPAPTVSVVEQRPDISKITPKTSLTTGNYSKTADPNKLNPYLKVENAVVEGGNIDHEIDDIVSELISGM